MSAPWKEHILPLSWMHIFDVSHQGVQLVGFQGHMSIKHEIADIDIIDEDITLILCQVLTRAALSHNLSAVFHDFYACLHWDFTHKQTYPHQLYISADCE